MSTTETSIINTVKAWALPGIFAIAVGMLNTNLQEMKADIKTLLAQSERDQVKIDYLEKEVNILRDKFDNLSSNDGNDKLPYPDKIPPTYAILPTSKQDGTSTSRSTPLTSL